MCTGDIVCLTVSISGIEIDVLCYEVEFVKNCILYSENSFSIVKQLTQLFVCLFVL